MTHSPKDLKHRVASLRAKHAPKEGRKPASGAGMAMRVAIELIASIMVSSAIGYQLDIWLGTMPLLLIICMLIGTAAGLITIKRVNEAYGKQLEDEERD